MSIQQLKNWKKKFQKYKFTNKLPELEEEEVELKKKLEEYTQKFELLNDSQTFLSDRASRIDSFFKQIKPEMDIVFLILIDR